MEKYETTQLLLLVSKADGRTIDAIDSELWHRSIGDLEYEAAVTAMVEFYKTEGSRYIRPAHVIDGVRIAKAVERRTRQDREREQLRAAQVDESMALPIEERMTLASRHHEQRMALDARHHEENAGYTQPAVDWMNPE